LGVKSFSSAFVGLAVIGAWLFLAPAAQAGARHFWRVPSPDHEQTFALGMEQNRVWAERGSDRHLVVLLNFTNDPYVDRNNPRQYDNFTFSFPSVKLGRDGHTFYYHAGDGRLIPVARRRPDFLGINEITLLPNASLGLDKPHGYLTLTLLIWDRTEADSADSK
jgi:hypothetical protein